MFKANWKNIYHFALNNDSDRGPQCAFGERTSASDFRSLPSSYNLDRGESYGRLQISAARTHLARQCIIACNCHARARRHRNDNEIHGGAHYACAFVVRTQCAVQSRRCTQPMCNLSPFSIASHSCVPSGGYAAGTRFSRGKFVEKRVATEIDKYQPTCRKA